MRIDEQVLKEWEAIRQKTNEDEGPLKLVGSSFPGNLIMGNSLGHVFSHYTDFVPIVLVKRDDPTNYLVFRSQMVIFDKFVGVSYNPPGLYSDGREVFAFSYEQMITPDLVIPFLDQEIKAVAVKDGEYKPELIFNDYKLLERITKTMEYMIFASEPNTFYSPDDPYSPVLRHEVAEFYVRVKGARQVFYPIELQQMPEERRMVAVIYDYVDSSVLAQNEQLPVLFNKYKTDFVSAVALVSDQDYSESGIQSICILNQEPKDPKDLLASLPFFSEALPSSES